MRLNLGCGLRHLPGFINCDKNPACHPDRVVDLEGPLPFPNNSSEVVVLDNVAEHIQNLMGLMGELHRIVRPGGIIKVHVPHVSYIGAWQDYTHVRWFSLHSLDYFLEGFEYNFYSEVRFKMLSRKLQFTGRRFKFLNCLSWAVNHTSQDLWERLFCWMLPMSGLEFVLTPVKKGGK
jgi:predicted SAM-dependent methyltransferase